MLKFSKDIYAFFLRRRRRSFSKKVKLVTLKVEVYRDWKFSLFSSNEQSFRQFAQQCLLLVVIWRRLRWKNVCCCGFFPALNPATVLIATVVVCLRSDPSRKSRTRQKKTCYTKTCSFASLRKHEKGLQILFVVVLENQFFWCFQFYNFFSHSLEHVIIQHSTLSFTYISSCLSFSYCCIHFSMLYKLMR